MVRPLKCRKIGQKPTAEFFKPVGIPLEQLQRIHLTVDEFEAIRLADFEGLYQEQAAERMNVSRQTFGNILGLAHRKIADALINGKALHIVGGVVAMVENIFCCASCRHRWPVSFGDAAPSACPVCGDAKIHHICGGPVADMKKRCRKYCRRMNYENLHPGQGQ